MWVCMYVFVLVLCFDGRVDGGGGLMPVQCCRGPAQVLELALYTQWLCTGLVEQGKDDEKGTQGAFPFLVGRGLRD